MSKNNGLGKNNVEVMNVKQLNKTMSELSLFSFEELEVPIYRSNSIKYHYT
jgi:hypothetical protein